MTMRKYPDKPNVSIDEKDVDKKDIEISYNGVKIYMSQKTQRYFDVNLATIDRDLRGNITEDEFPYHRAAGNQLTFPRFRAYQVNIFKTDERKYLMGVIRRGAYWYTEDDATLLENLIMRHTGVTPAGVGTGITRTTPAQAHRARESRQRFIDDVKDMLRGKK